MPAAAFLSFSLSIATRDRSNKRTLISAELSREDAGIASLALVRESIEDMYGSK